MHASSEEKVFFVDTPKVISMLRQVLPSHDRDLLVGCRIGKDGKWFGELVSHEHFCRRKPSIFVLEGICMYMQLDEVKSVLSIIGSNCSPGSIVLVHNVGRIPPNASSDFTFCIEPADIRGMLEKSGFSHVINVSYTDASLICNIAFDDTGSSHFAYGSIG